MYEKLGRAIVAVLKLHRFPFAPSVAAEGRGVEAFLSFDFDALLLRSRTNEQSGRRA